MFGNIAYELVVIIDLLFKMYEITLGHSAAKMTHYIKKKFK